MASNVIDVQTKAYTDQKPGTSGLRKRVQVFQQLDYTENFVAAILDANPTAKFLVLGGDGRFYSDEAIKKIINVCSANGVHHIVVAKDGILSTPAASALIRSLKADGGIVLTASHNPGGPNGDFGIKYNMSNGGPALEAVTNNIYEVSKTITSYKMLLKKPKIDLGQLGKQTVNNTKVEIVDGVSNYVELVKKVFDLDKIRELFSEKNNNRKSIKILVDCMNGVMGPYARRILVEELGAPESAVVNCEPLPDFGGKHPDPNLTYAAELVDKLKSDSSIDFGVAFDGDGDRNMVLGQNAFFVTPGDSLAVIANNIRHIKYFEQGCTGFARSFPTAPAVDRVAVHHKVTCYETPTGWKFFGNLLDSDLISICGEESFGIGSTHIREKDGMWACLAWLSVMASTGKSIKQLVEDHWKQFGRDYFCRYDFEDCDAGKCQSMMKELETTLTKNLLVGKTFGSDGRYKVKETGNFQYTDPVDKSVSSNQGLYIKFENGARIVVRLSGTGSSGATVRLYVSDYSKDCVMEDSRVFLKEMLAIAYKIVKLPEFIGRDEPTVIT